MAIILLLRHGEIPQSSPRRFIGQRDLPLTDRGKEQIARLAPKLAANSVERVFCSPLNRCLDSARIICLRLGGSPNIEPDLKEICLGSWEGLRVSDVRARYPGEYEARGLDIAGFRPAGGESFNDLQKRVWPVFETIAAGTETVSAIVAHAGVNRVILCTILGMPVANIFRIEQTYSSLTVIETGRQGFRVKGLNCLALS